MQIIMVSDVHANYRALQAILDKYHNADEVWLLGDIMEYGPCPTLCIELARDCCSRVIQGNHDVSYAIAADEHRPNVWSGCDGMQVRSSDVEYLLHLPQSASVCVDGKSYYLVHGSPQNPLAGSLKPNSDPEHLREAVEHVDADVIVCGHTHMAMILPVGDKTIVNLGTVGQPRDGDFRAQCMALEDGKLRFDRVAYDLAELEDDYMNSTLPEAVKYEWLDYTKRGVVDVHGLQLGPFSQQEGTI